MDRSFYGTLAEQSINGENLDKGLCQKILTSEEIELLPLLDAAFEVRKEFTGKEVSLHIINNAQNGFCPEDCNYCAQAKSSNAEIDEYPIKSEEEILAEARSAYESGAFRYCMVFAGRGPTNKRVDTLARLIQTIKAKYPIQICVSAGLMGSEKIKILKNAGLDRLNHNLNTSERFYPEICTTHTYKDRINTLRAAQKEGVEICSGVIVGMGETIDDVIDIANELRSLESPSIPVNFLVPIEGNVLDKPHLLSPQYCLRILCLFRFLNPRAEIRAAAGREGHLRSMEVMALYPANSIFLEGYLNTKGGNRTRVLQMIRDAGFTIKSDQTLDKLLAQEGVESQKFTVDGSATIMKTVQDLKPNSTTYVKSP